MENIPTLETHLNAGCKELCLTAFVRCFPDLVDYIEEMASQSRVILYRLVGSDRANSIEEDGGPWSSKALQSALDNPSAKFYELLSFLTLLQSNIRRNVDSDEARKQLWEPLAQCYAEVRSQLKERIVDPSERMVLQEGDETILPIYIGDDVRFENTLLAPISPYRFVLEGGIRPSPETIFNRAHFNEIKLLISRLERGRWQKIPVRIGSLSHTATPVELNVEAFERMYPEVNLPEVTHSGE